MGRRKAEDGDKRGVRKTYTEQELSAILQAENEGENGKSLRRIAAERYGGRVTHGVIQRAIRGEYPTDPAKREILGLAIYRQAPACSKCGEVHVSKRCSARPKSKAPRRIAIRCDDMQSAARTIMRNLEYSQVQELTLILAADLFAGLLADVYAACSNMMEAGNGV